MSRSFKQQPSEHRAKVKAQRKQPKRVRQEQLPTRQVDYAWCDGVCDD